MYENIYISWTQNLFHESLRTLSVVYVVSSASQEDESVSMMEEWNAIPRVLRREENCMRSSLPECVMDKLSPAFPVPQESAGKQTGRVKTKWTHWFISSVKWDRGSWEWHVSDNTHTLSVEVLETRLVLVRTDSVSVMGSLSSVQKVNSPRVITHTSSRWVWMWEIESAAGAAWVWMHLLSISVSSGWRLDHKPCSDWILLMLVHFLHFLGIHELVNVTGSFVFFYKKSFKFDQR